MGDAEIKPEERDGAWVRLPNGKWVEYYSPKYQEYLDSLGRKKEGSSDFSPKAPSPEAGSADKTAAELSRMAEEVSKQRFERLTSPEEKRKRRILQFLEELGEG